MQRKHLNREERERADGLNAHITQIKELHDNCLYDLRSYFDESTALLKYLELKTEYAYNDDCFYFYEMFIFRLKTLAEESQFCVTGVAQMETKLHQFCLQYNRLLKHLESAGSIAERSAIFSEMEWETDALLGQVIRIAEAVEILKIDFQHLRKEAVIVEAN